jgi:hypothetical protein
MARPAELLKSLLAPLSELGISGTSVLVIKPELAVYAFCLHSLLSFGFCNVICLYAMQSIIHLTMQPRLLSINLSFVRHN